MTISENNRSAVVDAKDSAGKNSKPTDIQSDHHHVAQDAQAPENDLPDELPEEHGGQAGLDPTRYGDWEKKGRCTDF